VILTLARDGLIKMTIPMPPAIPSYTPGFSPAPNVTPFTYRDGLSYVQKFENLVKYLNRVILPYINEHFTELYDEFSRQVNLMIEAMNEHTESFEELYTQLETFVNEQVILINGYADSASASAASATASAASASADADAAELALETILEIEPGKPEVHGAVGDGVTDDTDAFVALLATGIKSIKLGANKTYLIDADVLVIPAGGMLAGEGSSNYAQGAVPSWSRIMIKSNSGTVGVTINSRGTIRDVAVVAQNADAVQYYAGTYPVGTGNVSTGVLLGDSLGSANAINIFVDGFSSYGIRAMSVSQIHRTFVRRCDIGYYLNGSDGTVSHSVAMFCHTAGMDASGNYWRYTGNRIEWNATYGIKSAGESTLIGNLFDRNGWAGLLLKSGAWGHVVTGNYFSRNGCGGDGTTGRWAFSVPGHESYVATTAAQSCHIQIDYQRGVTITGNRYRYGRDDANTGANAPAYIYSSSAVVGATAHNVQVAANASVYDTLGYNAAMYSGVGAIAGGSDTTMSAHLTRVLDPHYGIDIAEQIKTTSDIVSNGITRKPLGMHAGVASATIAIPLEVGTSATIFVNCNASASEGYGIVYVNFRNGGSTAYTLIENKIGTRITSVAWAADVLTITLTAASWWSYNIVRS